MVFGMATIASGAAFVGGAQSAHADRRNITWAGAAAGGQIVIGEDDTYARYLIEIQALNGSRETREIYIAAALLEKLSLPSFNELGDKTARTYEATVGKVEISSRKHHGIGLGFTGLTLGKDAERGYSELLRGGIYLTANFLRTGGGLHRIDGRLEVERMELKPAAGPFVDQERARHLLTAALNYKWQVNEVVGDFGSTSGNIRLHAGTDFDSLTFGVSANAGVRIVRWEDFEASLLAQVSAERDPFREMLGLSEWDTVTSFLLDVSLVYRKHFNDQ
jgi:hypothetical protein